jgi:hypothetical protein
VTAMQAARAAGRLRTTIAQNALNVGGNSLALPLTILFELSVLTPESHRLVLPECATILRC